jgi:hypothetical protein
MFGRAPTPYPYAPQPYNPQGGFAPYGGGQPVFPPVPPTPQRSWPPPQAAAPQPRPPVIRAAPDDDPPPPASSTEGRQPGTAPVTATLPPPSSTEGRPAGSSPVTIPTPEELGVASSRTAPGNGDWLPGYRQLLDMGAYSFRIDRLPAGAGFQITCLLPAGQAQRVRRIETQAASEAEAVRLAVEEAQRWVAQKPR